MHLQVIRYCKNNLQFTKIIYDLPKKRFTIYKKTIDKKVDLRFTICKRFKTNLRSICNQFVVTLVANRTLATPTNLTIGQTGHIYAIQDGTGGRTLSYNAVFKFPGGTDPVATTSAGAVNLLVFSVRATDKVDAVMINDLK